jgi:DivIVA domain-containing protein
VTWFLLVVGVLVMGVIGFVAAGRGEPMVEEYDDRPDALVPATGDLGADDLRRVRFSLAFRGYRMSEVDELLTRLADQLEAHRAWQPDAAADGVPTPPEGPDEVEEDPERRGGWTRPG